MSPAIKEPIKTVQLASVVDFLSGFAFKSSLFNADGRGLPLIRIRDVTKGKTETFYDGPFDSKYLVEPGDYLIGMDGEFNLARWVGPKALLNQRVCKIAKVSPELDSHYLARYLPRILKAIEDATPFVTVKHLSIKTLGKVSIPIPPLNEQRRISDILDRADTLRAKRRQAIDLVNSLTQSIFLEMFGDLSSNRKQWPVRQLSDCVREGTIVTYGIVQAGEEFEGGVPYIRTGDIKDGYILEAQLRRTDPSIAVKFERSRVEEGDIVMSIRATVGTTAQVPRSISGANLTQGTARIAPGKHTDGKFLLHYLRTPGAQQWIQKQVKGATFREITLGKLRELPVLLPPVEMQRQFATYCKQA